MVYCFKINKHSIHSVSINYKATYTYDTSNNNTINK